jgi:hypothetical protein
MLDVVLYACLFPNYDDVFGILRTPWKTPIMLQASIFRESPSIYDESRMPILPRGERNLERTVSKQPAELPGGLEPEKSVFSFQFGRCNRLNRLDACPASTISLRYKKLPSVALSTRSMVE